ncbi:hypothetical protein Q4S45_06095 [Massilia sp. R2A-15]|nr:hypothetical protein [Massilia sp. R2A-15]WLI90690.1 hypothetical protein Q4S45_06095 [Massilia sp. R2A-15]
MLIFIALVYFCSACGELQLRRVMRKQVCCRANLGAGNGANIAFRI